MCYILRVFIISRERSMCNKNTDSIHELHVSQAQRRGWQDSGCQYMHTGIAMPSLLRCAKPFLLSKSFTRASNTVIIALSGS
jgi:hypothetical protein